MSDLKDRFIRETETLINKLVSQQNQLLEEAQEIDVKLVEARQMLQYLKTGQVRAETSPRPIVSSNGVAPEAAVVAAIEEAQRGPDKPRKKPVAYTDEELIARLQELPERFTTVEAGKHLNVSMVTVQRRLRLLAQDGKAKMLEESKYGLGEGSHGGRRPSVWRVTQAKVKEAQA
jgi:predicted HTH transcriptional regulator